MKDIIIILTGFLAIVAVLVGIAWAIGAIDCWAKLDDSGKGYRYKLLKGCQYQTKEGWLSYDRLRDLAE
jgi:hypothetical protein